MTWTPPATVADLAREWSADSDSLQRQLGADLAAAGDSTPALWDLVRQFEAEAAKVGREIDREVEAAGGPDDEEPWENDMRDICVIYTRSAAQLRETLGGLS